MESLPIPQSGGGLFKPSETYRIGTPPLSPMPSSAYPHDGMRSSMDVSDIEGDSSGDDDTVQVLFNRIYIDPRQEVMDMLDDHAASVLRTGKITVVGECGDMDILQPLLFSLQAVQEDIPVLLPQLLRYPFFKPDHSTSHRAGWPTSFSADYLLQCGHIRLGVSIDNEIYQLLKFHCCKGPGARQAEALIETACSTSYVLPTCNELLRLYESLENMPPLLLYENGQTQLVEENRDEVEDVCIDSLTGGFSQPEDSCLSSSPELTPRTSNASSKCKGPSLEFEMAETSSNTDQDSVLYSTPPYNITGNFSRDRKNSIYDQMPHSLKRDSIDSQSSVASTTMSAQDRQWHCSLPYPRDMIVGMYGDTTYPVLTWSEELRVTFQVGSSSTGMSATTVEVEPLQRTVHVKLRVHNDTQKRIAISIRAHRQSMSFKPHIIYPSEGLHLMEVLATWEKEFEIVRKENSRDEYIAIDLLVCVFGEERTWNVQRRYVVVKYSKQQMQPRGLRRVSRGQPVFPGSAATTRKDFGNTLKQVILHGLQSVVKNKLDEADIIFTQALHLPVFQRVPLKAFAYICLAVVANKRRKKDNLSVSQCVRQILRLVSGTDRLVEACENATSMTMPKMVALVKQLKKELNPSKIITEARDVAVHRKRSSEPNHGSSVTIGRDGGTITSDKVHLQVPGGALPMQTSITLSQYDRNHLHKCIQNSQWANMLQVLTAVQIHCRPPVDRFSKPVIITLPAPSSKGTFNHSLPLRLLHSNYLNHWRDITDNPMSHVEMDAKQGKLEIQSDHTGWLVVASVQLDVTQLMRMALKTVFSNNPVPFQVNVFGHKFSGSNSAQICIFVSPVSGQEDERKSPTLERPPKHVPIAFPHTFEAHIDQKIRLELQGAMEPDTSAGQSGLVSEFCISQNIPRVVDMTVKLIGTEHVAGKLLISSFCNAHDRWVSIQEINLAQASLAGSDGH